MTIMDGHWRALCAYARHLYPEDCPTGGFDSWHQYSFSVNGRSLQHGGANEVEVEAGKPVRLRVLDAGTMAFYRVHLAGLEGKILALDGRRVKEGSPGQKVKQFPISGASRVDVLLQIPKEGGCFPIKVVRVNSGTPGKTTYETEKTEQGALILKTKDAGPCPLPDAYSKPNTVKQMDKEEWMETTGTLKPQNPLEDPLKKPDAHHILDLSGTYDFRTGENRPGFTINNTELHLWPARVWCKVKAGCEGKDSSADDTVLNEKFCQGEAIISYVKCDEFACPEGAPERDQWGRCLKGWTASGTPITSDAWGANRVHVDECGDWKIRPQQYKYNPHALEVCHGDRVWLTYVNKDKSGADGHPIHLHGTHQQLVKVDGKDHIGPMKDTWFLLKGQSITVAFDALNPGEWLVHCHIEHHVINGMGTTLRYVISDRCEKRLDEQQKPNWVHTPGVSKEEWPHDWHQLWHKKPPTADFFPEAINGTQKKP